MKPQLPERLKNQLTAEEKFALLAVEGRLRSAEWLKPAAGFGRRWLGRIKQQNEINQRVRAGWLVVGNSAAALLVLAVLISQLGQPTSWLARGFDDLNSAVAIAATAVSVSLNLFQTFPVLVIYPTIALMLLVLLWSMLIRRSFNFQGEME